MPDKHLYEYAVIRIVPRVEREEFMNIGIILYCRDRKFLQVKYALNELRLLALYDALDIDEIKTYVHSLDRIACGDTNAGPIAQLDMASRFRWLTAVRSTIIQTSRLHPGFSNDLTVTINRLFEELVL